MKAIAITAVLAVGVGGSVWVGVWWPLVVAAFVAGYLAKS